MADPSTHAMEEWNKNTIPIFSQFIISSRVLKIKYANNVCII